MARDDYVTLSVSFITKDQGVADTRYNERTQAALILLIPTDIMVVFSKPLRNISKIAALIKSYNLNE